MKKAIAISLVAHVGLLVLIFRTKSPALHTAPLPMQLKFMKPARPNPPPPSLSPAKTSRRVVAQKSEPLAVSTPAPTVAVHAEPKQPDTSGQPLAIKQLSNVALLKLGATAQPSSLPSEDEAPNPQQLVQGWLDDFQADRRVRTGEVDPYFRELRASLEKETAHPPAFAEKEPLLKDYFAAAERYGRTGSQGGTAIDFGEGRMGNRMVALVEVKQDHDGHLKSTFLVQKSGDSGFDTFVLGSVAKAIEPLQPPELRKKRRDLRTLWEFSGRVSYLKKSSAVTAKDIPYFMMMAPLGLLGGTFDETTGSMNVLDFRHPQYNCDVKLLRIY